MSSSECPLTDQQLWLLLKKGDENAFALLFERHHRTLYNYGIKLAPGSAELVEDAIQDLFVDIWRLRRGLTSEIDSVRFYLYRALRRKIHRSSRPALVSWWSENIENGMDIFSEASHESRMIYEESRSQRTGRLREMMSLLPERQLEALTLKYFDNFSIEEIASIMDVNEKSVRNFLYKALSTLRQNREWLIFSTLIVSALAY